MRLRERPIFLTMMIGLGIAMLGSFEQNSGLELSALTISYPSAAEDIEAETNIRVDQQTSPAVVSIRAHGNISSSRSITLESLVFAAASAVQNAQTAVTLTNISKLQANGEAFVETSLGTAQNSFAQNAQLITPDGQVIYGELTPESNVLPSDNSHFNSYLFEGKAGQQAVIEMSSHDFDSYLILIVPGSTNKIQSDGIANRAGASITSITTLLPEDGTYLLLANSVRSGSIGPYSLRVLVEDQTL